MAQPRAYSQTTTFNDFTVTNPSDPHSGSSIDTELTELKQNTDDLNTNIALLQRDDGKIKNATIHKDSFDQDALALIGASGSGFAPQGDWTNLKTTVAITTWATDGGSPAANIMTKVGHGLTDTTVVRLTTTVTLPTGFVSTSDYFVVSATADTFKLSGTSGGDPIAFTDVGSGTHSYSFPNTYVSGNIVNNNDATYLTVATSHTTGSSFAGDKALGHWTLIANSAIETSAASVDVTTSIASQVLFPTTYTYSEPKDIQVFVNGLLISPSLYTISNTGATSKDITFTTAPATGATVIIWGATVISEAAKAAAKIFRDTAGNHSTTASRWASLTTDSVTDAETSVDSSEYSAKAWAVGGTEVTGATGKGSALDWAIGGGGVVSVTADGTDYSAKKYAADAVNAETAVISVANAMSNMHNNFDDRYLGSLASSHLVAAASSITGAVWVKGSSLITSATQASGTITVGQVLTNDGSATGWPTTTTVRILAYDSGTSTITINQIFSDAQAGGETLTGVGYGVQGVYVVADLGPSTDNDGNTLLDGSLYYNTTTDALMVYDLGNTIWKYTKPTALEQTNINIVGGELTYEEDLGSIADAVTTSSGNNITDVVDNKTNIDFVAGQISPTNNISALGPIAANITTVATAPIPANMATIVGLGTNGSEVTAVAGKATEIGLLGTSAMATASTGHLALLGTSAMAHASTGDIKLVADIHANVTKVADIDTNVTKVADIDGNVTIVAGLGTNGVDVTTVAGKATEIGRLGTADAVADMNLLATTAIADPTTGDLKLVADIHANVTTCAGISTDITQVVGELVYKEDLGGIADAVTVSTGNNITDVADNETNINFVAGQINPTNNIAALGPISANITTVAGIGTNGADITTVAGKDTEIGLLGTSAMATASTGHLAYLGTSAMANTTDGYLKVLGVASVVTTIGTVSTNVANVNLTGGSIANVNLTGGSIANVNLVGGSIADVNRYATEYKIASTAPGSPSAGDLWYDSTTNTLKFHTGSAFSAISGGIAEVADDTTPTLGGDLDAGGNDITNMGNIGGANLNIDFGSIA